VKSHRALLALAISAGLLALAGCGKSNDEAADTTTTATPADAAKT